MMVMMMAHDDGDGDEDDVMCLSGDDDDGSAFRAAPVAGVWPEGHGGHAVALDPDRRGGDAPQPAAQPSAAPPSLPHALHVWPNRGDHSHLSSLSHNY